MNLLASDNQSTGVYSQNLVRQNVSGPLMASTQGQPHLLDDYFQRLNRNAFNPEARSNSQAIRGTKIHDGLGLLNPNDLKQQLTPSLVNRDTLTAGNRQHMNTINVI